MVARGKRLKVGDVLEVRVGDHFAYVQFIGKHPEYGDALLVSPRLQNQLVSVTSEIFADSYVTFYPASAAVGQGLAQVVAHLPSPPLPGRLRRAGKRSGTRIDTWVIEDGSQEVVKAKLSEDELRLPIASIWNHEALVQRIAEGWNPTNVGREPRDANPVIREANASPNNDSPRPIRHFLYVPTRKVAVEVAQELNRRGFTTEEIQGADEMNWLILAGHEAVFTEETIASTRSAMEALVAAVGGKYDGWEVDVRTRDGSSPSRH